MSRRRLTWNSRGASAPPATPGYQEPSVHPAAYPDPEADAYENGDTSAWAEDPKAGPYPNGAAPALPGTSEPQGHPATDPAHYFPGGAGKQASRQLRAALEAKAAQCIRIASAMLGRKASPTALEDQALDLMNLTDRQIQAALRRLAETEEKEEPKAEEPKEDAKKEAKKSEEEPKEEPKAEEPKKEAKKSEEEPEAEEPKEDDKAAKKAAYWAKQAAFWAKKAEEEEAKKDEKPEADKEEGKKAGEDEPDGDEPEADKEEGKKKAGQNDPGYFAGELDPEEEAMLASMLAEEEAPVVADDVLMDDAEDPMGFMDSDDGMSDDDMSAIYGSKAAGELPPALQKINDEKAEKAEKEEKKADEEEEVKEEEPKEAKKASGLRPQPRSPSNGVKTLGQVAKVASSSEVSDLSKLWESAPDISKAFG